MHAYRLGGSCCDPGYLREQDRSTNLYTMSLQRLGGSSRAWLAAGAAAACIIPSAAAYAEKKKDDIGSMFDPEALERGAKALREINASPYAKQVGWPSS